MTYDAIIFTGGISLEAKPFGAYKIAHELRVAGFSTLVVNHLEYFTVPELKEILVKAVGDNTLFVGTSNTFFSKLESGDSEQSVDGIDGNCWLPGNYTRQEETEICDYIKALNPKTKIVLGGTRTYFNISNTNIDYVFIGYSDQSVVNFAHHLSRGDRLLNSKKNLSKIIIIDDNVAKDFDFPNSSMVWTDDDIVLYGETLPLEISRGCIFSCKFCSYRLNGKQALDYLKDFDNIRNELIHNYERYGITCYRFVDDTFNDTEEKIDAILKISESLPFELKFWAYIRLDLLATRPHTIDKLYRAGLRSAFFGIETLNKKTGLLIGKGFDPDRTVETINKLKQTYGDNLYLHGSFICGLPEENLDSVSRTMERLLSREINLDSYLFYPLGLHSSGIHTWESAFDMDMQKHGYSEDLDDNETNKRQIPWKNKYMTYRQAKLKVDEFIKLTAQQCRIKPTPIHTKLTGKGISNKTNDNMLISRYKKQLHKILNRTND
jgi:radical SAM superfamily enzyme YgiQ (UPF0313 family)